MIGINPYGYQPMNPYNQTNYNSYTQGYNQTQNLTRVTGIEGARAYQMGINSTVALFDSNDDLMYIKSTDGAGFPTIRTFKFTELFETDLKPTNDYISRDEFEQFKKEIMNYGKQFISEQTDSTTTE